MWLGHWSVKGHVKQPVNMHTTYCQQKTKVCCHIKSWQRMSTSPITSLLVNTLLEWPCLPYASNNTQLSKHSSVVRPHLLQPRSCKHENCLARNLFSKSLLTSKHESCKQKQSLLKQCRQVVPGFPKQSSCDGCDLMSVAQIKKFNQLIRVVTFDISSADN